MGRISSPIISEVNGVRFVAATPRIKKATRVVSIGEKMFLVELANGEIIVGRQQGNYHQNYCFLASASWIEIAIFKGLAKLGIIREELIKEHDEFISALNSEQNKKWALQTMQDTAKEYGFKLTKSQIAKLQPKEKV